MEKFLELREKAEKYHQSAERSLNFTYKLVKENRVLLMVVNNLFLSCTNIMGSLLHYELLHKRINPFEENFETKFRLLKSRILEKYNLDTEYLKLARDLKEIIIAHNESPIEFSRGNKLIICNDNYELREITDQSLRQALMKTKLFIDEVILITNRVDSSERIFI